MNALTDHQTAFGNPDTLLDVPLVQAIAELAKTRGDVRFTLGGGILFDTPITKVERLALPAVRSRSMVFLDLPQDRFNSALVKDAAFQGFVNRFTVPHARDGYRLVVIPLTGRLTAAQLTAIAGVAETFGHGALRVTPDVSIRLPNVPVALLKPLFAALTKAGLVGSRATRLAA